ncbi:lysylphosphatidylglycerol synthase transmembrane domain-containing protein [Natrinema limicola]|uniref:Lysylphosphatidylglycerol synthetase/UPF0104 n=1 Tax=Natrinema limicola JCM 13563 TaxID=1230457 RepID=M0CJW4_9EURY|nr:lysylphosphatidylglycerol synthase transmembrane domain-containing protein [Natrinema limicola]ELZ22179.1 hypothetical protein C476_07112 [Natrinema limicola JCM 13563]
MTDGDEQSDSNSRVASALTRRRLTIAGTILVVAGLAVAVREIELRTVVAEIASADPVVLGAAVAVYVASWPLRGRRYSDVLAAMEHRSDTAVATIAVFVSQTANLAIPARAGDAVRAYVMNRQREVPYAAGFASLTVERLFDLATIATLAMLAMAWLAVGGETGPLELLAETSGARTALLAAAAVSTATVGVGAVIVTSARADHGLGAWLRAQGRDWPWLEGALEAAVQFAGDVQVVARQPRALATIGAGSLVVWSLDVLTAVLVLGALDSGLSIGALLSVGTLAVSVGNLAKVLPLSQGGVGLYEAAFTALVVGLTPVGASVALAAAIVDHALKNGVTLLGGVGAGAWLGLSLSDATTQPEATRKTDSVLGEPKK